MNSFLLSGLRAFLRYMDLRGEDPANVYIAGLILAVQPSFMSIIFGQHSLPDPDWQELAKEGIQVQAINNAGHGMAWDNPEGVAEAIAIALP